MGDRKYAIGVDFGTESGRALLVEVETGREVAGSVYPYANGVIDERLPGSTHPLEPDWALQDPEDYLRVFQSAVPQVVRQAGIDPSDVVGIGIDFTACTMLPVRNDGAPLCTLPAWRTNPHAWVKLWKHHAAQPEADQINATAERMGQAWLERYGGKISSEWFFSKVLQILNEAPEVYAAADRMIEAADWVVWQLTGVETRNACTAGYKAIWSKRDGFPPAEFFAALHPQMASVVEEKMSGDILPMGQRAGGLTEQAAGWTGLAPGTAVAVANVDAHVAVPAATVTEPGRLVLIMGTSTCHLLLDTEEHLVPGICGYVEDGIIPGYFGYEAGQSCVGDHFAWFVENCVPEAYVRQAASRGMDIHAFLEEKAAELKPGESGLLALDWWNGNRSVLVDVDLTGLLLGATLATRPEEIYRALIEATAYGTRVIVERFQEHGLPIYELVACGGLPEKNKLLMQIYADVTGCPFKLTASGQAPALGSAMFGAVAAGRAAGGYDTIYEASQAMARLRDETFVPDPANKVVYDELFAEYKLLHDYFGRGDNDVMKRLKNLKARARGVWLKAEATVLLQAIREELVTLNQALPANGLVAWTSGNVSLRDPESGYVAIKPSGVAFPDLTPESMVVLDLNGAVIEGRYGPSSDTDSHLYIYRRRPDINSIVHTHSNYATAFAAIGQPIPVYLTAQADEFGGPIPCGGFALIGGEEIGKVVVESIGSSPGVLLKNHGVFTVGSTGASALKAAVMVEDIARTVWLALQIGAPEEISAEDVAKLHYRYTHIYGQRPEQPSGGTGSSGS